MASNIDEELHGMVKDIVDELESAVNGCLYRGIDGEFETIDDGDMDEYMENHDEMPEQVTVADVIEKRGLGDTRFEVDSRKELCGGKTLFTFGGPNIWVHDDMVCGYWGTARVEMSFNPETKTAMFDWFNDRWKEIDS